MDGKTTTTVSARSARMARAAKTAEVKAEAVSEAKEEPAVQETQTKNVTSARRMRASNAVNSAEKTERVRKASAPAGPEETLVINFKKYWDHGNRDASPLSPFTNSLKKQYSLLSFKLTDTRDLSVFIFNHIAQKTTNSLYISHPPLSKPLPESDEEGNRKPIFLENAVLRIHDTSTDSLDIVLIGNIEQYVLEKDRNKIERREFIVKSLSLLRPSSHWGEVKIKAKLFVVSVRDGDVVYYKPGGIPTREFKTIYANSIITREFVSDLAGHYIVKNEIDAINRLNEWKRFLACEREEIEVLEDGGYLIERPEFIIAYPVDREEEDIDPADILVTSGKTAWVSTPRGNTAAHLLVRLTHPVSMITTESDLKYKDSFNKLTAEEIKIDDPMKKQTDGWVEQSRDEYEMCRIGGERIAPASLKGSIDEKLIEPLRNTRREALDRSREAYEAALREELGRESERFREELESGDSLEVYIQDSADLVESLTDEEIGNRADRISADIIGSLAETKGRLDEALSEDVDMLTTEEAEGRLTGELLALYGEYRKGIASSRLSEVRKTVSRDECRESVISKLRQERVSELCKAHISEIRQSVARRLLTEKKVRDDAAWNEFGQAIVSLKEGGEKQYLTVFYEIDIDAYQSVSGEAQRRNAFFAKSSQFKIVVDSTGKESNISNLEEALDNFMKGEVSNPFLASYLFSTEDLPTNKESPVEVFFHPDLNPVQKQAVRGAVNSNGLYLIQGPPGTGKTQVISEIITQEVLNGHKVLVTSQNNKAVDNAFERLSDFAIIRPIRMMASNKKSDYELSYIVSNFYRNISEPLEYQAKAFGDPKRVEEFRKSFEVIKEIYSGYTEVRELAKDKIDKAKGFESTLIVTSNNIEKSRREIQQTRSKIEFVKRQIEGIDSFDPNTFRSHHSVIADVFRRHLRNLGEEDRAGETDRRLFGPDGYCSRLLAIPDDVFEEQMFLMNENRQYLALLREVYEQKIGSDIRDSRDRLEAYVTENNIRTSDFILADLFRQDLPEDPEDIRDIRGRLRNYRESTLTELRTELDSTMSKNTDDGHEEDLVKKFEMCRKILDTCNSDDDYIRFRQIEDNLRSAIQMLYNEMYLSEGFSTLDEAYRILETAVNRLGSASAEKYVKALGKVSSYLATDGVDRIEHDAIMKSLVDYINVVGITCTASGNTVETFEGGNTKVGLSVGNVGTDVVIVDEVSKVPFHELLRPILSGSKIIMVGDHKQLPPMYNVKYDKSQVMKDDPVVARENRFRDMYTDPLFQNLFEKAPAQSKIMLNTQYRMAEQIMNTVNRFYEAEGGLNMGCSPAEKMHRISIENNGKTLIEENNSVFFINNSTGKEDRQKGGTSFFNRDEAETVAHLVDLLSRRCKYDRDGAPIEKAQDNSKMSMGIITPYAEQAKLIGKLTERIRLVIASQGIPDAFIREGEEKFMVKSVDDFQGDERDIIILSLVRTSSSNFLSDFRRINVAMSRARRLLIIVGNAASLENQAVELDGAPRHVYKEIIDEIRSNGCYLESEELREVYE